MDQNISTDELVDSLTKEQYEVYDKIMYLPKVDAESIEVFDNRYGCDFERMVALAAKNGFDLCDREENELDPGYGKKWLENLGQDSLYLLMSIYSNPALNDLDEYYLKYIERPTEEQGELTAFFASYEYLNKDLAEAVLEDTHDDHFDMTRQKLWTYKSFDSKEEVDKYLPALRSFWNNSKDIETHLMDAYYDGKLKELLDIHNQYKNRLEVCEKTQIYEAPDMDTYLSAIDTMLITGCPLEKIDQFSDICLEDHQKNDDQLVKKWQKESFCDAMYYCLRSGDISDLGLDIWENPDSFDIRPVNFDDPARFDKLVDDSIVLSMMIGNDPPSQSISELSRYHQDFPSDYQAGIRTGLALGMEPGDIKETLDAAFEEMVLDDARHDHGKHRDHDNFLCCTMIAKSLDMDQEVMGFIADHMDIKLSVFRQVVDAFQRGVEAQEMEPFLRVDAVKHYMARYEQNPEYPAAQEYRKYMNQVVEGMNQGLDPDMIALYARPDFTLNERKGLMDDLVKINEKIAMLESEHDRIPFAKQDIDDLDER